MSNLTTTYLVYVDDNLVDVNQLVEKSIHQLTPIKGEVILHPFNYDDKERTSHKPVPQWFHGEVFWLYKVRVEVADSWNSSCRNIVHLHLEK